MASSNLALCRLRKLLMLHVIAAVFLLKSLSMAGAVEDEMPPEPEPPKSEGLTRDEFMAAVERWRTEHAEWEAGLTAKQVVEEQGRNLERIDEEQAAYRRFERLPLPSDGYDWRAFAERRHVPPEAIARLERDQMAFGESCRQSFQPYLSGPVFITSDSLLNAFHVLFEDSFRELEMRRAESLRPSLSGLRSALKYIPTKGQGAVLAPERFEAAAAFAERVLGTAMALMGESIEAFDAEARSDIALQVDLIQQAESVALPSWLEPSDPASLLAIDYGRFKPVGFYAESPRLSDYFRAIRWLQLVPFRASREAEFDAMVLLAVASETSDVDQNFANITNLMGRADDPTMVQLRRILDSCNRTTGYAYDQRQLSFRNDISRRLIKDGYYRINSDLRAQRKVRDVFQELTFRVVSAAALPEAITFQEMIDRQISPSGMSLAALLGSSFATQSMSEAEKAYIIASPANWRAARDDWDWYNSMRLYPKYLDTLESLFAPLPENIPPFMKSEAWAAKSCQTALASWAQMRHTFTLQAKMNRYYLGLVEVPPGFVEPNPEFFARMSSMIEAAIDGLERESCFRSSAWEEADRARELANWLRNMDTTEPGTEGVDLTGIELSFDDLSRLDEIADLIGTLDVNDSKLGFPKAEAILEKRLAVADSLDRAATVLESEGQPVPDRGSVLRERWEALARSCRRLESLAHKQLRELPWTEDEEAFLKKYGESMAFVMGYFGNSWLTPRDDAPRWVEIVGYPSRGTSLAAAIGRPRYLYVLYPWQGIEVLCQGAVMQYFEYETDRRLTDKEWLDKLDTPEAPTIPSWLRPFAAEPGLPVERH